MFYPPANISPDFPNSETVNRSLLLATLQNLSPPHFLGPPIANVAATTREHLTIILFSRHFNSSENGGQSRADSWQDVQRLLTYVYVQATRVALSMDKVLMGVDVLLKGLDEDLRPDIGVGVDVIFRVDGDSIGVPLPPSVSSIRQTFLHPGEDTHPQEGSPEPAIDGTTYSVVALGGTFDHLHAGHKILLSMGAWLAHDKLIVGITDDILLQGKANKHILENLPHRMARVHEFLTLFKPSIHHEIVPITDVHGPTGWDPNIHALVVSKETLGGHELVLATHRQSKSLPPLRPFVIDLISSTEANVDTDDVEVMKVMKMSSTSIRQWIVDKNRQEEKEAGL
ncbi:Nucleotidylyl transferase [Infundibulicybe gibba]|nr:Nucleotidylyl transferase [Infundibulicybe gibba]